MFQAFNNSVRIVIGLLMLGWFGYLFWHFGGMAQNGMEKELGPTVLGIGALLLLILLPLVFRMIRGATKLASSEPERICPPTKRAGSTPMPRSSATWPRSATRRLPRRTRTQEPRCRRPVPRDRRAGSVARGPEPLRLP